MPISATGPKNNRHEAAGFTPVRRYAEHGFTPVRRYGEHGFTPVRRYAEHGFTLVELMVVVTVIALAAAAVAWSMPDPAGRVGDEAARFALRVRAAHDAAIVEARPVGVWITAGGYGFDARESGTWRPMARPLAVERWAAGTRATLDDPAARVRVVFDATGLADRPLEVRLQRRAARAMVRIGGDGSVAIDG